MKDVGEPHQRACFLRKAALSPMRTGIVISKGTNASARSVKPRAFEKTPRHFLFGASVRSVAQKSKPIDVQDFTRGAWRTNPKLEIVRA